MIKTVDGGAHWIPDTIIGDHGLSALHGYGTNMITVGGSGDIFYYNSETSAVESPDSRIDFSIYPNPVSTNVTIQLPEPYESGKTDKITICDLLGNIVFSSGINDNTLTFNLTTVYKGMLYVCLLSGEKAPVCKKLIRE